MTDDVDLRGTIGVPNNLDVSLPVFVYGFLQPRELAYGLIAEHISSHAEDDVVGTVYLRDGLPLFCSVGDAKVHGFVLKSSDALAMYTAIGRFEPRKQYRWKTVSTIGGQNIVNILAGISPAKGSTQLDGSFRSSDDNVLKFGPAAVQRALYRAQQTGRFEPELMFAFDVQMAYLLVWSILERFMALRYGPSLQPNMKLRKLSEDRSWQYAIQRVDQPPQNDRVVSSLDPNSSYCFDSSNPLRTLNYFYQYRSNLVHRGKAAKIDATRVETACRVLVDCMREVWLANSLDWLAFSDCDPADVRSPV